MPRCNRSIALVLAAAAAAPTLAGEATGSWTPPDVVVTAKRIDGYAAPTASSLRTPVPIIETPQSVQVLTRALIEDQELNTLDEALANVSGVVPSLPSEILLTNPIVRGFEAEIFTDGMIGYGDTAVSDPASLWHVERIEVAKGPTSTLFGGGIGAPVGGLINLVSKTAGPDPRFAFRLRGGSFDSYSVAADANLPASDTVAVRLVGEWQDAGDYINEVDIGRVLLAPSIRIAPSEATEIIGRLNYSRVKQLEYVGLPAALKDSDAIERDRFTSASNAPKSKIENIAASLELNQRLNDSTSAALRVRRYENDFDEYSSSPLLAFFPCIGTICAEINGALFSTVKEWTVDGSLTTELETGAIRHVLLAGAQWDRVNYEGELRFDFVNIGVIDLADPASDIDFVLPAPGAPIVNHYRTLAFYAQDQMTIGERLHVLASLRYSKLRINEVMGGAGNDETYHEIDPRIGVTFDVTDGLALFAGYASGSRLSLFFTGTNSPVPERSESWEGGLKFGLTDFGLTGTLAAFRLERTNVPTPDPATFFTSIQTGKQRSRGVELDLVYEPTRALSVLASFAYTDAEVTADTLIPAGDRLARVPKYQGRFAARYRFLDGAAKGLELGAGVTAVSKAYLTLPNNLTGEGRAVVDAQASYELGRVRIGLRVDNLFDRKYFAPYQYYAQDVVRPGNPRSAYVTLGYEF